MWAELFVDGQKIDRTFLKAAQKGQPFPQHIFKGIAVSETEKKELLFSLPRFVTQVPHFLQLYVL
jgi:hypothetical protein